MSLPTRYLSIAALVCVILVDAVAVLAGDCRQMALDRLRASSPGGFSIYEQTGESAFFVGWIDCADAQFDLSTAVHESAHFIASETDMFPLVGGGAIERPHEVSAFYPPAAIADRFKHDDFAAIYLRGGKASSSGDFLYLLDELNAYSHDLATAVDLRALTAPDEAVDHRDGLAALMAFVAIYVETAKTREPATWSGLRTPRVSATVSALWSRAEQVMASSCGIPNFGSKDKDYIRRSCSADASSALEPILGRSPVCSIACLAPTTDFDRSGEDAAIGTSSSPDRNSIDGSAVDKRWVGAASEPPPRHRPFDIRVGPARHGSRARY